MREIKFRAWDGATMHDVTRLDFMCKGIWIEPSNEKCGFLGDRFKSLIQSTGLKDKNRKEIWEGDICHLLCLPCEELPEGRDDGKTEIVWDKVKAGFRTTHYAFPVSSWASNKNCSIEVIGNIYEHKELIG